MGTGTLTGKATTAPLPEPDWDEPRFQRWCVATARANGYRVRVMDVRSGGARLRRGHASDRGWPDLLLVKDRLFWVELKPRGGKLRPDQVETIAILRSAGAEVRIFDPTQFADFMVVL